MANIRVDVLYAIKDGAEVSFRSPADCSHITGLKVYYPGEDGGVTSKEFALADAHGNNVGDIDHLFAEDVMVKVILDVTHGMAYVQNADTNAYLEAQLASKVPNSAKKITYGELDSTFAPGWYYISGDLALGFGSAKWTSAFLRVDAYGNSTNVLQTLYIIGDSHTTLQRFRHASAWRDWEYVRPNMSEGVPYKTTELYDGKPVYKKVEKDTGRILWSTDGSTWNTQATIVGARPDTWLPTPAEIQSYALNGGTEIPSGADLNTYITPNSYRCPTKDIAASLVNCPHSVGGFSLIVERTAGVTGIYIVQTLKTGTLDATVYKRAYVAGTWGEWGKEYSELNKPTAKDVGARSDTWLPTPSQIGALSGTDATLAKSGVAADAKAVGDEIGSVNKRIDNLVIPGGTGGGDSLWTESTSYGDCFNRVTFDGETEWLNPPMAPGVEYRTPLRWRGNYPVYAKMYELKLSNVNSNLELFTHLGVGIYPVFAMGRDELRVIPFRILDYDYIGLSSGYDETGSLSGKIGGYFRIKTHAKYGRWAQFCIFYTKDWGN